ncbi:hypothetical protein ACKKBF_B39060 [Auxenochlorella protothecoides x Auxenochlorella symbiontica]
MALQSPPGSESEAATTSCESDGAPSAPPGPASSPAGDPLTGTREWTTPSRSPSPCCTPASQGLPPVDIRQPPPAPKKKQVARKKIKAGAHPPLSVPPSLVLAHTLVPSAADVHRTHPQRQEVVHPSPARRLDFSREQLDEGTGLAAVPIPDPVGAAPQSRQRLDTSRKVRKLR